MFSANIGIGLARQWARPLARASSRTKFTRPNLQITPRRTVKTATTDWKPLRSSVTDIKTAEYQSKMPILRRFFLGLMIAMPVISFFLGCWQVRRLNWKVDLIAKCEDLLSKPPLEELPPNIDPEIISEFEFRRFNIKGHFDYSQELFLGPRMRNGAVGYLLITPFIRSAGGDPILVERGWIKKEMVIPENRSKGYLSHLAFPQGEIELHAFFRVMPSRSSLQFEHNDGSRLFHIPDVAAMAAQAGTLPIYCQAIYSLRDHPDWKSPDDVKQESQKSWTSIFGRKKNSDREDALYLEKNADIDHTLEYQEFEFINQGVPVGAIPKVNFTNNHLQYLVTWFGLSIASTGLLFYTFWKKKQFLSAEKIIEAKRKDMRDTFDWGDWKTKDEEHRWNNKDEERRRRIKMKEQRKWLNEQRLWLSNKVERLREDERLKIKDWEWKIEVERLRLKDWGWKIDRWRESKMRWD